MKTIKLILASVLVMLFCLSVPSLAEDIDIYSNIGGTQNIPNVMFVIDSAANSDGSFGSGTCTYYDGSSPSLDGSKVLGNEQCALANIVHSFPVQPDGVSALINVGVTTATKIILPLTPLDDAHRDTIISAIKGYSKRTGFTVLGQQFQETWAYYTGGNKGANGTLNNVGSLTGTTYDSATAVASTTCAKNYIIAIGASPNSAHTIASGGDGTSPYDLLTAVDNDYKNSLITQTTANTLKTIITPTRNNAWDPWGVEWARYMNQEDTNTSSSATGTQRIKTYSVNLLGTPGPQADMSNFWSYVGSYGGGKSFTASTYSEIVNDILKILNEVQAVNSVFASSTLPVSVNTQGTYLNQVFMGMFRPDANGLPRWVGNLKQYKFIYNNTNTLDTTTQCAAKSLCLADSLGIAAISGAGTGFISPNAVSFWTSKDTSKSPDSLGGFWVNSPSSAGGGYDSPDGEIVEKGGAAQQTRLQNLNDVYTNTAGTTSNPRNLYTYCPSGSGCNADLSDTSNVFDRGNSAITDAMLGTGPVAISSITSASTLGPYSTAAGATSAASSVSITAWSKSGSTVTATVSSSDITKISIGTQLVIATSSTKYNCNPCSVTAVSGNTFSYTGQNGSASTPATPYVANIYTNFVQVTTTNSIAIGQTITFSNCSIFTGLNSTIATVTALTAGSSFTAATTTGVSGGPDTNCKYTPNTVTVTTTNSLAFNNGDLIQIASASPTGYNNTTTGWSITVTGNNSFTFQYTSAAPLANCAAGTCSATATNASSTRDLLLRWVRGEDNYGDESGPGSSVSNVRPSLHGDVLHSRPIVINFGGTTGIVAYYGANDGVFRAVNGNQTTNPTGSTLAAPGSELWGFIPSEFYSKLGRLRSNSPQLSLPTTPSGITPTPQKKDYFVDGPTGLYQVINSSGTTDYASLYLSMRRGGRLIYALKVADKNDSTVSPTKPRYLWKLKGGDSTNYPDFTELGQTWSEPKVAFVEGYKDSSGNRKPVLIFGAGYDTNEDSETLPRTADTMGRGIFIVDALTGAMIWSAKYGNVSTTACTGTSTKATCSVAGMDYAIPSEITLVDKNNDGVIDRMYAVDVGGNVWRVDLEPSSTASTPDKWQVEKLAALGCDTGVCASSTTQRKFFYRADMIPTNAFDAVIVGSGDREHPLSTNVANGVTNQLYMLKDTATGNDGSALTTITQSPNNTTGIGLVDETNATSANNYSNATDQKQGYFITLANGEKVVNAPSTAAGSTFFGTNKPGGTTNSCSSNLGIATGYTLSPLTGTLASVTFSGGGLPPTPVYGFVNIDVTNADGTTGTKLVPFIIGAGNASATCTGPDCTSSIGTTEPPLNISTSRTRTHWYIEKDQ